MGMVEDREEKSKVERGGEEHSSAGDTEKSDIAGRNDGGWRQRVCAHAWSHITVTCVRLYWCQTLDIH
jgi:hypothetical protein